MRIGKKLIGSFLMVILILIIVALVGFLNMMAINDGMTEMYYDRVIPLSEIAGVGDELLTIRGDTLKYILVPEERPQLKAAITQNKKDLEGLLLDYKKSNMLKNEEEELTKFEKAWQNYYAEIEKTLNLVDSGAEKEALISISSGGAIAEARKPLDTSLANIYQINTQDAERLKTTGDQTFSQALFILSLISVMAIIISLVLAFMLTRSITTPVDQVKTMITEMGRGHLSIRLKMDRQDELGDMARTMDLFCDDLQHLAIANIRKLAEGERIELPEIKDEKDEIMPAIQLLTINLRGLTDETSRLISGAKQGQLTIRGDAGHFKGRFQEIIAGINETLDAVVIPVEEAMRLSKEYGTGNFTARFDPNIQVSGDFIDFKNALNHLGEEVGSSVGGVKHEVEGVSAGMEEAAASVEEVASSMGLLSDNATNVSSLAERSGEGTQQTLTAMEDLSRTVASVANKAEVASGIAQKTVDLSNSGMELAGNAEKGMQGILQSFGSTETMVGDITNQMDEIGRIVDVITGIAEQTGLLALNAAIEAARAGDAGMGFAVVADEVKSLALESQKSAENIAMIIGNLQKKSMMVSDSMQVSSTEVKAGNEAVGKTLQLFDQIVQSINEVYQNMTEVAGAAEEQAAAVEEITASITEVDDMVKRTSQEAISSAAAAQQISAAVSQINRVISDTAISLQQISDDMGKFSV